MFAVHISDGYLAPAWLAGGWAGAAALAWLGARRLSEDEVARVALLTAAFFVASSLRVPVGPTTMHLVLNGLVGVVLGVRAGLAVLVGLALQFLLAAHGGLTTVGVNTCVIALPALAAGRLFRLAHGRPWALHPAGRFAVVTAAAALLAVGASLAVELAVLARDGVATLKAVRPLQLWTFGPAGLGLAVGVGAAAAAATAGRGEPTFALGVLLGEASVLAAAALNCLVLASGSEADTAALAVAVWAAHLPVAAVEGLVLGSVVTYLARVKPELLGPPKLAPAAGDPS